MIIGAFRGRSFKGAASAVDAHYKLKDRARTALDFVSKAEPSDLHTLQIEDAEQHLAQVKASDVAPFRLPKSLAYAASLLLLAVRPARLAGGSGQANANRRAGPLPSPRIGVLEAEKTVERLKELMDELAKSERDPELGEAGEGADREG